VTPEDKRNYQRYLDALHAVQSAIALDIEISGLHDAGADPKHLRTGVNSCLVDSLAISRLLMAKGVFTESEYFAAIADAAEQEQRSMTERMRQRVGDPRISFG
jgi:hypothetical protein